MNGLRESEKLMAFELARRGWTCRQIANELCRGASIIAELLSRPANSQAVFVPLSDAWKVRLAAAQKPQLLGDRA